MAQLRRALRARRRWVIAAAAGLAALLVMVVVPRRPEPLPDFAAIDDINARKAAFFSFLEPHIEAANARIQADRDRLEALRDQLDAAPLNRRDVVWLRRLAERHRVELDPDTLPGSAAVDALLLRVDAIPPSLALAQAALESGWGTSRFARMGNNLFGIWCYTPGCGMVPKRRPAGATYEVARYRSPSECFLAYIQLLNSNPAYRSLWEIRRQLRADGEPLSGLDLAAGLLSYSEEGERYIAKVRRVIRSNGLQARDTAR
jgi:Bax protein